MESDSGSDVEVDEGDLIPIHQLMECCQASGIEIGNSSFGINFYVSSLH